MQSPDKIHLNKVGRDTSGAQTEIKLPLCIVEKSNSVPDFSCKVHLLDRLKITDTRQLVEILNKKRAKAKLNSNDFNWLNEAWTEVELDDLDFTELFVCYLPTIIDKQTTDALVMFDPMPRLNKRKAGDLYDEFIKKNVKVSAQKVARVALPRVRAKLALKELICFATGDIDKIISLVEISPRYLKCAVINELIVQYRTGDLHSCETSRRIFKQRLERISSSVLPPKRRKARKYGYWKIDYYYSEILECVKIANKLKDQSERDDYIRAVDKTWGLPYGYADLLKSGVKNPAETTLDILIAKGIINEPSTYRNVIKPHIKKIKDKYPSIRACDELVEHLLDLPTRDPNRFAKLDIWKQLELFELRLTDQDIKARHYISYPTTAIRV